MIRKGILGISAIEEYVFVTRSTERPFPLRM